MKKKNIHIFKLTHHYIKEEVDFCIKTELEEKDFVKLIKVIQHKAFNIKENFPLSPSEMADLLLQYEGNRPFPNEEDIKKLESKGKNSFEYIKVDLYNIWEASNIIVTDDDLKKPQYKNENVIEMIKNYIEEDLDI